MKKSDEEIIKELEALKAEYARLDKKRIETATQLKSREDQLKELKEKELKEYCTNDVNELKKLLEEWRAENERKVAEYRQHIEHIKKGLAELSSEVKS
jgi:ribosomal protein L29